MATFNQVTLLGRLTDDPQERALGASGKKVASFRLAVSKPKKGANGQWENDPSPLYIDCEAFSGDDRPGLAGVVMSYARKGGEVLVVGELKLDTWDDKQSGQKRSKHKVWIKDLQLLGGRPAGGDDGDERPPQRQQGRGNGMPARYDDRPPAMDQRDIPF